MNKKRANTIINIIAVVILAVVLISYSGLPDMIPGHWGADGAVDRWIEKKWIFGMWLLVPGVDLLMRFAEKIDPKWENYKRFDKVFLYFRISMAVFMSALVVITLVAAKDPALIDMNKVMFPMMGLMFAMLGNYMPKVKYNYTFGIKTPHTLASENVWNKTHRMAGPLWVVCGLLMACCGFVKGDAAVWILLITTGILVVVPVVYAYLEYKKEYPGLK